MATSKEVYAWTHMLKGWAASVDAAELREHMLRLADELVRLAEHKEIEERQVV